MTQTASARSRTASALDSPEMVLIFRLSGEAFAISVSVVHEILDPIPVTRVPNAPAFAPGLINVRGQSPRLSISAIGCGCLRPPRMPTRG